MLYSVKPLMRLLLLPLLLMASSLFAQSKKPDATPSKEVEQYLAEFQKIVKKKALYADSIDWAQLRKEVKEKSRGLRTIEEGRHVLDHILHTLRNAGDKHSFLIPKEEVATLTSPSYAGQQAESRYLGDGVGYLKVPEFTSMDASVGQTFSQGIQSQMEALQTKHTLTGWVVDLRQNTGGNMNPMIEGLKPLLGEGIYAYDISPRRAFMKEKPRYNWSGKEQQPRSGAAAPTPQQVAILIDSLTASSGEMVAIALMGRDNARVFGQPSAGYTTANQDFKLSDGAYLLLAAGYRMDRTRKPYLNRITPDVVVEYSPKDTPDKTIEAAQRWLRETK
ncbi:S41 family peptidase [Hymenobacter aerilatus]|uniref:S41 family peptidase n=1 Tax=Hymenobacter aerilatus TaxID=2932251 RepID=A0A8T9T4F2_9BACT|nr:S41 family peptidase [Hymenobacter aerilatus]UOR06789.1 S41 family peptidase [Hymenobacter aerilatus]